MLLSDRAIQEISQDQYSEGRRLHFYDRGETIPMVAQGFWQVYRGVAQLSKLHPSGDETLLGWAKPSTFLGMRLTEVEAYQARALSEIYLKWYPLSEIESYPNLAYSVLTQVMRRLEQAEALLAIAGLRKVEERLRELLRMLKQEMGQPIPGGTRLQVRLTHQTLANAIRTTRVTVTRLLGDFQRQGLIALDSDRHLIILDAIDIASNSKPGKAIASSNPDAKA